jgi:hypothetical protein
MKKYTIEIFDRTTQTLIHKDTTAPDLILMMRRGEHFEKGNNVYRIDHVHYNLDTDTVKMIVDKSYERV